MKTWKNLTVLAVIAVITLALAGCKDDPPPPPDPHTGTITVGVRTIPIKGDGTISATDFAIAKEKVEDVMYALEEANILKNPQFVTMLDRPGFAIIIKTGNSGPDADTNKSMTIGVGYLLTNEMSEIGSAIIQKAADNAFAD